MLRIVVVDVLVVVPVAVVDTPRGYRHSHHLPCILRRRCLPRIPRRRRIHCLGLRRWPPLSSSFQEQEEYDDSDDNKVSTVDIVLSVRRSDITNPLAPPPSPPPPGMVRSR